MIFLEVYWESLACFMLGKGSKQSCQITNGFNVSQQQMKMNNSNPKYKKYKNNHRGSLFFNSWRHRDMTVKMQLCC